MSKKKFKIYSLIIALILIGGIVLLGLEDRRKSEVLAPFEPYLSEYTSNTSFNHSSIGRRGSIFGEPYIKKKFIAVDIDENEFDRLINFDDSLLELRATTPEEVGTVIWLSRGEEIVGRYTDGTAAIKQNCYVQVIDMTESSMVGGRMIYGSSPPSRKTELVVGSSSKDTKGGRDRKGSSPISNVIEYIKTLPRR